MGRDLDLLERPPAFDLQRSGALIGLDPLLVDLCGLGDAELLGALAGGNLSGLDRRVAFDLAAPGGFLADDPRLGERAILFDPGPFGAVPRRDLGPVEAALPFDLLRSRLEVSRDARLDDGSLLVDARPLGRFGGGDLRSLQDPLTLDLQRLRVALVLDASFEHRALLQDARAFDLLAERNLGGLHHLLPVEFALTDVALGVDPGLGDRVIVGDAGALDRFPGDELRPFGLGVALSPLAGEFGPLLGAAEFDFPFLLQPCVFAFSFDVESLALRLEVASADLDDRVLFDVVAQFAARLDRLDQLGEALGVEAVRRIEEFEARLIEIEKRDRFELETVLRQAECATLRTCSTKSPGAWCISSMDISAVTARMADSNLPTRRPRRLSASSVRRPRVDAASATASRVARTRT